MVAAGADVVRRVLDLRSPPHPSPRARSPRRPPSRPLASVAISSQRICRSLATQSPRCHQKTVTLLSAKQDSLLPRRPTTTPSQDSRPMYALAAWSPRRRQSPTALLPSNCRNALATYPTNADLEATRLATDRSQVTRRDHACGTRTLSGTGGWGPLRRRPVPFPAFWRQNQKNVSLFWFFNNRQTNSRNSRSNEFPRHLTTPLGRKPRQKSWRKLKLQCAVATAQPPRQSTGNGHIDRRENDDQIAWNTAAVDCRGTITTSSGREQQPRVGGI